MQFGEDPIGTHCQLVTSSTAKLTLLLELEIDLGQQLYLAKCARKFLLRCCQLKLQRLHLSLQLQQPVHASSDFVFKVTCCSLRKFTTRLYRSYIYHRS